MNDRKGVQWSNSNGKSQGGSRQNLELVISPARPSSLECSKVYYPGNGYNYAGYDGSGHGPIRWPTRRWNEQHVIVLADEHQRRESDKRCRI